MDPGIFSVVARNCNRQFLKESWAEGVETIVTNDRYFALDRNYNSTNSRGNRWNENRQRTERINIEMNSPIVDDLVDNLNQRNASFIGDQPTDRVFGYTLSQIQSALNKCRDINCWERNLRNRFNNPTENRLTELFDYLRFARSNNPNACD